MTNIERRNPAIYSHLQSKGWRFEREHLLVKDFPGPIPRSVGLTDEAVRETNQSNMKAFLQAISSRIHYCHRRERWPTKWPESATHVITTIDRMLDDVLRRYNLKLPKNETRNATAPRAVVIRGKIQGWRIDPPLAEDKGAA
jgi:hypothetical protein